MSREIKGYTLVNEDKLNRVIYGSLSREGKSIGGVGEEASEDSILAHYDKLGGLIKKGEYNLKVGGFWDSLRKAPRATPKVQFVFRDVEGKEVLVDEGSEVPLEVKASEISKTTKKVRRPKA